MLNSLLTQYRGDRFMVNVVSTFNIQNNQITIDQRKSYKATA
jgi:hypothetical protein